jgi:single-stranded-DNA-specific exonuclease
MTVGIRCLLAPTAAAARPLAAELDRLNRERRDVEATMRDEALAALEAGAASPGEEAYMICVYRPEWHQGVIGIVAGRLKDRFHRPAIVFAPGGSAGELRGSGRSIAGFHLRDALDAIAKRAPDLIVRFGGHAMAAGLTLAERDLPRFAVAFEALARETLGAAQLRRIQESDGVLDATELDLALAQRLRHEVWGQGFPAPVFDDAFRVAEQRIVGGKHSRLTLAPASRDTARYPAILFNSVETLPQSVRVAYRPEVSEWNGTLALELVVEHWLPA